MDDCLRLEDCWWILDANGWRIEGGWMFYGVWYVKWIVDRWRIDGEWRMDCD